MATELENKLLFACLVGDASSALDLINRDVDVNTRDKDKLSALHLAAESSHTETVRLLIENGADVNIEDENNRTPLHLAVGRRNVEIVKLLIENGADVNVMDCNKRTPLHRSVDTVIVKLLIKHGADVNIADQYKRTPLHLAIERRNKEIVKLLMENGADVNVVDEEKRTHLHRKVAEGNIDIVKLLLENDAAVNVLDKFKRNPLHLAAGNGYTEILQLLIHKGADVNVRDVASSLPLHLASTKGYTECVKLLIEKGAEINVQDMYERTPLHLASKEGYTETVKLLIQNGADTNVKEKYGKTAKDIANDDVKKVFKEFFSEKGIPKEIKQLGKEAVKLYLQARSKGSFSSNVIRCLFVGHYGVGKTTLVRNLLGLKRIKAKSTDGIDVYLGQCYLNTKADEWVVRGKHTEMFSGVDGIVQIDIWDFAGQLVFYTTHQTYLSRRCLYFLVFNLAIGLHDEVADEDLDPFLQNRRKVIDFLEFWIGSIKLYANSEHMGFPRIVLVGTHKDKVTCDYHVKEVLDEIRDKFRNLLESGQLILREDLLLNAIDMTNNTQNLLRNVIFTEGQKYPEYGEEIPSSWMELHQKIYAEKQDRENIIQLETIKKYNTELQQPLPDDELKVFLLFLHQLGYILYFDVDTLKNFVILNPKWTIDSMKCLITCQKFALGAWRKKEWEEMRNSGKVEQCQIERIWKKRSKNLFYKHRHHLLLTMENLDLICRPKVYDRHGNDVMTSYYYIPCMLKRRTATKTDLHETSPGSVQVSFIFQNILPPAVFNRLLSACITLWQIHDGHLYQALAAFRSGKFHVLLLFREFKQIRLQIRHLISNEHIDRNLCLVVNAFINQTIDAILSTFGTSLGENLPYDIEYNESATFIKEYSSERYVQTQDDCDNCQDTCKGLEEHEAKLELSDSMLMRIGRLWRHEESILLCANLLGDATFLSEIQMDYPDFRHSDLPFIILHEWKRRMVVEGKQITAGEFSRTCARMDLDPHTICKVLRQKVKIAYSLSPAFQMKEVTPELLDALSDRISTTYLQLGLELGFQFDQILQLRMNNRNNSQKIVREMLKAWMVRNKPEATVMKLATALVSSQSNIEKLIEAEDKGLDFTEGQREVEEETRKRCPIM